MFQYRIVDEYNYEYFSTILTIISTQEYSPHVSLLKIFLFLEISVLMVT